MRKHFLLSFALFCCAALWAVDPSVTLTSYYSAANCKQGDALRQALKSIISSHTDVGYSSLGTLMQYSDTEGADGTNVVDIYTNCTFTVTGPLTWKSSGSVGDGMNREHTVPQSWFSEATPMVSDAFHIYPTDCKANNNRSSYLYGEFSGVGTSYSSEKCSESGKLSTGNDNSIASYSYNGKTYSPTATHYGKVYEPADEYKGDIARGYFYMATCYADKCSSWSGGAFGSDNNGLATYTAELMLKWHRLDPVSEKELLRNEVIYGNTTYNKSSKKQGNRNPFIDYPELVEYIWGDKKTTNVDITSLVSAYASGPSIAVSESALTFVANQGGSASKTFTITGSELTSGITIAKSGTNSNLFTISPTSINSNYNNANTITVTYQPTAYGTHPATLTISSTGAAQRTISLSGTCTQVFTATWWANGSEFTTTTAESEQRPDVPASNPNDCSDTRVFKGWTAVSGYSGDGSDLITTTAPTITANTPFYAVYADKEGEGGESVYAKVTSTDDITNGQYLIVYESGNVAMNGGLASLDVASNTISVSINESQIEITEDTEAAEFTIAAKTGGYSIKSASNKYIGHTGSSNALKTSDNDDYTITLAISDGNLNATCNSYNLRYNSASGQTRFRFFSSPQQAIQLYKKMGGSPTYSNYSTDCNEGTKVTITFHKNDGSDETSTQKVLQSTDASLKTNVFTRTHYTFDGWATTAEGAVEYTEGATINTTTDVDLFAKWKEETKYTVMFMNMGVAYGEPVTNYAGESIGEIVNPTACDGYTFKGWSSVENDSTTTNPVNYTGTIPVGGATYYAVYSKTVSSGSGESTDYELYSGALAEGDYIIYYDSKAMNTTVTSGRLGYEEVTPADDKISSPDSSIIWHIAASGDYWTIYNEKANSYAAGTGAKNKAQMLEDGTDDKSLWTASGESTYEFVNKANTAAGVNANLRNNGTYGFACYATTTGGALSLYKKSSGSSTTYYTTAPDCGCKATITITAGEGGTVEFVEE